MKTLLHVGCGSPEPEKIPRLFRQPGWRELRLDIDPATGPDIVASITDLAPVATGSVDAVYSSHNLEHLYPHEVAPALAELRRVLAPAGFALLTMPDLQAVAELVAAGRLEETVYVSPLGPVAPIDILYGFRPALAEGNLYMAHRTGFTAASLDQALRRAGFAETRLKRDGLNLWAAAGKTTGAIPAEILQALG